MKVRPSYINALGRQWTTWLSCPVGLESVYGSIDKAQKPFVDVTEASRREVIAAVARAAEEAYERNDLSEARRLYTIAIISTQRRNVYFLIRRAQMALLEGR